MINGLQWYLEIYGNNTVWNKIRRRESLQPSQGFCLKIYADQINTRTRISCPDPAANAKIISLAGFPHIDPIVRLTPDGYHKYQYQTKSVI